MKKKIIELVKSGLTYKQVSEELGCAISTVSYNCKKENIESIHTQKKISESKINEIKKLYDEIGSSLKVAKQLGISKTTVLKYVETKKIKKLTDKELKENKVEQVLEWRKRAKIKLVEYKGGKCERCGYNKCIEALEFHHRNPSEKSFTISGKSFSLKRLKKEADKCILVCSNCHKEIHSEILVRTEPR